MSARRLALELTNRCNLDCRHCLRDSSRDKRDLPLPLIRRLLAQAKRFGISQVAFTGGEPLLHPRWQEVLRLTARQGYQFSLVTNGHRLPLAIPFFCRPAIRAKLLRIAISLDGPDAASHDAIRGRGSFRKVMAAIAAGHGRGLPLRLKFTVTRKSVDRLEEMALLAAHLGLEGIEFSHMFPTPDNLRAELMLTPAEWRQVEARVQRLAQELKILVGLCSGGYDPDPFFNVQQPEPDRVVRGQPGQPRPLLHAPGLARLGPGPARARADRRPGPGGAVRGPPPPGGLHRGIQPPSPAPTETPRAVRA